MIRPRPRVTGKINPGVAGKGESPVGNTARTVPKPLASTRSQAAMQMLSKYRKTKKPQRTGSFTHFTNCDGSGYEVDSD